MDHALPPGIQSKNQGMVESHAQGELCGNPCHARRGYYAVSPLGQRQVQLAPGLQTLAFVGSSDKESIARIQALASLNTTRTAGNTNGCVKQAHCDR